MKDKKKTHKDDLIQIKEDIRDLIITYLKKGLTEKDILNELNAVIYWEMRERGILR